jgi:hypothetical protein
MLYLQHDFYNIIFKIKQIICNFRVSPPPPPRKNSGCAPVDQELLIIDAPRSHTRHTLEAPLDEWSARRRDLYVTKHNIHDRQTYLLYLRAQMNFYPYFPCFLTDVGEIRYRFPRTSVEQLRALWESRYSKRSTLYGEGLMKLFRHPDKIRYTYPKQFNWLWASRKAAQWKPHFT